MPIATSAARPPVHRRTVRLLFAVLTLLSLLTSLLVTPPHATAAESSFQEAETTCTGGQLLNEAGYSVGLARAPSSDKTSASVICSIVVPEGRLATFRWYGTSASTDAKVDVVLSGATTLSTSFTRPVTADVRYGVLNWQTVLNAGTTTLTASRFGNGTLAMDYWTVDPDTAAPSAPSSLTTTRAGQHVDVAWAASTDNLAVTGYRLRIDGGAWTTGVLSPFRHTGGSSASHTYEVQAYDGSGNFSPISTVLYGPDTSAPSAPTGLVAQTSGGDVRVTWTASTDNAGVAGYRIRVGTGAWTDGVVSPWLHAGGARTSQTYEVRAYDAAGNESAGGTVAYSPPPDTTAPSTPGGVSATRAGSHVDVAWAASTDDVAVTGYRLRVDGGAWTPGVTSPFRHTGGSGTSHTYEVQAYDAAGNSSASGTVSYVPPPDTTAPSTPTGLVAKASGADVSVTWTASTDDVAVAGYRIRVGTGAWTDGVVSPWLHAGGARTSQTYEVRAYDAAGNESAGGTVAYSPPADMTAPTPVGDLAVTASDSDLSVSWSASSDNVAVTGYRIRADGGDWVHGVSSPWSHPGGAGSDHAYEVQAYDAAGNLSATASTSWTAPRDTTPPTVPGSPSTTDSGNDVLVTWSASTDNVAVTGYRVRVVGGAWTSLIESPWTHVGGASTAQTYEVQAYDAAGNLSASVTVSHTPPPTPTPPDTSAPTAPGSLTATASGTDVAVSWSAASDDTVVAGYRIRVDGGAWTTSAASPWRHVGSAGMTSTYDVQAYDAAGNLSAIASVTYTPAPAFTDTLPGTVAVTSPAAGGGVAATVPTRIHWATTGLPGPTVRVELVRDTDTIATLAAAAPLAVGSLVWTPARTLPAETTYSIRLTSTTDERITSTSGLFAVTHPTLSVTSHATSNTWTPGARQTVTWSYSGTPVGSVQLQIVRREQVVAQVVAAAPYGSHGNGSASFIPPASLGAYADYRVRASWVAFPASFDSSDGDSSYAGAAAVTLATPSAGATWTAGSPYTVSWSTSGTVTGDVRIDLLKGSQVAAVLAASVPAGAGGHTVTAPAGLGSGDHWVRVTSRSSPTLFDRVPVRVSGASLSVAVPDPSTTWIAGTPRTLTWSVDGAPGAAVRLDLVSSTGRLVPVVASTPLAAGRLTWSPPLTVVPAGNYRIRATVLGNPLVSALSPVAMWTRHPTVDVAQPLTAQRWTLGAPATLSWQLSHPVAAPVTLTLVRDGGASIPVATGRATGPDGSGSFTWTPPLALSPTSGYRLRVTATRSTAVRTTGSALVELRRPLLTLTSPGAGTTWDTGTTVTGAWQFDGGAAPPVRVELLRGATPVAVLASSAVTQLDGRGSFSWPVPAALPGSGYTLRVRPAVTPGSPAVEASLPLTVNGPTVGVDTPAGWSRGSTGTVSWTTSRWAGTTAKVELVNGTRTTVLHSAAPMGNGAGSYTWSVPSRLPAASTYRLRVTLPGSASAVSSVFAVS